MTRAILSGVRWSKPLLAVMALLLVSGTWCATALTQHHDAAPTVAPIFSATDSHAPSDPEPHCLDTALADRSTRASNGDTPSPVAQVTVVAAEMAAPLPPALSTILTPTPPAASGALRPLSILRI